MVRVYRSIELSALIALANSVDLFHDQTKEFLDKTKRLGFEPISCKQAVEMDLAIGAAKIDRLIAPTKIRKACS